MLRRLICAWRGHDLSPGFDGCRRCRRTGEMIRHGYTSRRVEQDAAFEQHRIEWERSRWTFAQHVARLVSAGLAFVDRETQNDIRRLLDLPPLPQ